MTHLPIDPAAAPDDPDARQSAPDHDDHPSLAERIGRQAENHILPLEPVDDDFD